MNIFNRKFNSRYESDRIGFAANALNTFTSVISGILAVLLITFSVYVLYDTLYIQGRANLSASELAKYKPVIEESGEVTNSDTLARENPDYRAWLTIKDTKIDYPVMQGENDMYYSMHNMMGESSLTGALYLAAENAPNFTDSYNIVYGHHMINDSMFGGLDHYISSGGAAVNMKYFNSHRTGTLIVGKKVYSLRIFAVARTSAYESTLYTPGDHIYEVMDFLQNPAGSTRTLVFDRKVASTSARILAMSTCADGTASRLIVFARMKYSSGSDKDTDDAASAAVIPSSGKSDDEPDAWALLNLIALLAAGYMLLPIANLRDKYGRLKILERINNMISGDPNQSPESAGKGIADNTDNNYSSAPDSGYAENDASESIYGYPKNETSGNTYKLSEGDVFGDSKLSIDDFSENGFSDSIDEHFEESSEGESSEMEDGFSVNVNDFKRNLRIGIIAEAALVLIGLIAFLITEDIAKPVTLVDKWTPVMILITGLCWIADVRFVRYRGSDSDEIFGSDSEEEDDEQE